MDYAFPMKTAEDVESYLLKLGVPYEQIKPGIWHITGGSHNTMVVEMKDHLVAFDAPRYWRLALVIPFWLAANGVEAPGCSGAPSPEAAESPSEAITMSW